ncbi:MAG: trypsin-like peptidase domain-containing protein [Verrucomicrobiales bacterium]|nr:trypsin-like peptidase domain-containing protein [Verrucomicrobiales bacterium]
MDYTDQNLRDLLAKRFWRPEQYLRMLSDLDIPALHPMNLVLSGTPREVWHGVVATASFGGYLRPLSQAALAELPNDPQLKKAAQDSAGLSDVRSPEADLPPGSLVPQETLEALTQGLSTLLPIGFLQRGLECARSVARLRRADGATGTGWLLPGNWLITNHHVLPSEAVASKAQAQFGYEENAGGVPQTPLCFDLDPALGFHTSPNDGGNDWTAVRVRGDANEAFGALRLSAGGLRQHDFVNIIQHPNGLPKQIALYHNAVSALTSARVRYLTDTDGGSSGSPVFNTQWEVVALHHASVSSVNAATGEPMITNQGIPSTILLEEWTRNGILTG